MNRKDPDYPLFKEHFWKWFDQLPKKKKEVFWRYKDGKAETNFYFTVYSKNQLTKSNLEL